MITIPVNRCKLNTINNQNELIKCELIFYEVFNNQIRMKYSFTCIQLDFHWFWSCYISMDSAGCVWLDVFSNALLNVKHNHL